jgi:hypothetical protein
MGIVFPCEAIARHWDGALQARLRRAPLEKFLASRGVAPAPVGVSQDSDNLARATVLIVEAGLAVYFETHTEELEIGQRALVGHIACSVNRALAKSISRPEAWRIAALLSAARLLTPWIGLSAAAKESASCVRGFQLERPEPPCSTDERMSGSVLAAVAEASPAAVAAVSARIAQRFTSVARSQLLANYASSYSG